jgi:tetratricopeptide (TPR) repeat protein
MSSYFKVLFSLVFSSLILVISPKIIFGLLYEINYYFYMTKYTFLIINNPNNSQLFYNRGTVRSELGDRQGAIADFTEVIKIRSSSSTPNRAASAYFQRGQEYELLGNKQKAILDYKKAAQIYKIDGKINLIACLFPESPLWLCRNCKYQWS